MRVACLPVVYYTHMSRDMQEAMKEKTRCPNIFVAGYARFAFLNNVLSGYHAARVSFVFISECGEETVISGCAIFFNQ
jgi:hypothetical protein